MPDDRVFGEKNGGNWVRKQPKSCVWDSAVGWRGIFAKVSWRNFPSRARRLKRFRISGFLRKSKLGLKAKSPAETQTGRKRRAGRLKHLDSGNPGILTLPARRQTAACPSGISRFAGSLLPARLPPPVLRAQTRNLAGGLGRRSRYALRINV